MRFGDIEVSLFAGGESIATTSTNEDGFYLFDDVLPGSYSVLFDIDDSYEFVSPNQGEENQDSDVTNEDGSTDVVDVVTGDVDAGYKMRRSGIAGSTWIDENRNGTYDQERPLANVNVELYNTDGDLIETTTSNDNGNYMFVDIISGDYYVVFDLPENYDFTIPREGSQDLDSDVTGANGDGSTDTFSVAPGNIAEDIDAGYISNVTSISGKVWKDNNEDNIYNDGDELVEGLGINLLSERGEILGSTNSGADGTYIFDNLSDGSYLLCPRKCW